MVEGKEENEEKHKNRKTDKKLKGWRRKKYNVIKWKSVEDIKIEKDNKIKKKINKKLQKEELKLEDMRWREKTKPFEEIEEASKI